MDVLLALKDAIESDARIDRRRSASGSTSSCRAQGLLQPLGQGGRAQGAVRVLRAGSAGAARQVSRRGRGDARQPPDRDPITGEERKPDERFLRSVEEKIHISDSGKQSFRQEVVRKAMGAYKRGEKFTLDSHAPLHDAVEQYLFEQRRDVLRLVSSATRPDEESRRRFRWSRSGWSTSTATTPQRARSAELRHHAARAGIGAHVTVTPEYGGPEKVV
jgi:serine protein kinase